jgi:hypothetical protein
MIFWLVLKLEISNRVTENPLYNHTVGDYFFFLVTLTNCDINVYNHTRYSLLQDCDYRQKNLTT